VAAKPALVVFTENSPQPVLASCGTRQGRSVRRRAAQDRARRARSARIHD
jgi:hypothetical protein